MRLECGACGKVSEELPDPGDSFVATHLVFAALSIGWSFATRQNRFSGGGYGALFCDDECRRANVTKEGILRMRKRINPKAEAEE